MAAPSRSVSANLEGMRVPALQLRALSGQLPPQRQVSAPVGHSSAAPESPPPGGGKQLDGVLLHHSGHPQHGGPPPPTTGGTRFSFVSSSPQRSTGNVLATPRSLVTMAGTRHHLKDGFSHFGDADAEHNTSLTPLSSTTASSARRPASGMDLPTAQALQRQLDDVLHEVRQRQHEHDELHVAVRVIQQRLNDAGPQRAIVPIPSLPPGVASDVNSHELSSALLEMQDRMQASITDVLEQHQQRFDEAMQQMAANVLSPTMSQATSAASLHALERRVDELVNETANQASRLESLSMHAQGQHEGLQAENNKVVALMRTLREQQEQHRQLLQEQQQDLQSVRTRQQEVEPAAAVAATRSLEMQLHELVLELRKLQREQQSLAQTGFRPSTGEESADGFDAFDVNTMAKELREETGHVATMLDNVRQEKCEVIAMMHTFQIDKDEALREMDSLRRTAREELSLVMPAHDESQSQLDQQMQQHIFNGRAPVQTMALPLQSAAAGPISPALVSRGVLPGKFPGNSLDVGQGGKHTVRRFLSQPIGVSPRTDMGVAVAVAPSHSSVARPAMSQSMLR